MKIPNKVIGISGVAGAGKDLFFTILSRYVKCKRYALADKLKLEVNPFCKSHYKIDLFNCNREEKESVRDFLVFHGTRKRKLTDGKYYTKELNKLINKDIKHKELTGDTLICVTDIRYDEYKQDEIYWLKNMMGGSLCHVSQFEMKLLKGKSRKSKVFRPPANAEEKREDPKLKAAADFTVEWPTIEGNMIEVEEKLESWVHNFIFEQDLTDYVIDKENYLKDDDNEKEH